MSPMLGLFSLVIKQKENPHIKRIFDLINADRDKFFPPQFDFVDEHGTVETRELFGPLVGKMEQHVMDGQSKDILHWTRIWEAAEPTENVALVHPIQPSEGQMNVTSPTLNVENGGGVESNPLTKPTERTQ